MAAWRIDKLVTRPSRFVWDVTELIASTCRVGGACNGGEDAEEIVVMLFPPLSYCRARCRTATNFEPGLFVFSVAIRICPRRSRIVIDSCHRLEWPRHPAKPFWSSLKSHSLFSQRAYCQQFQLISAPSPQYAWPLCNEHYSP